MGINYKYDLDTVGGGWYLYEMDIMPEYIAPIKPGTAGEGKHAWGIYDKHGRMSDFRIGIWKWKPSNVGFVDGYIIDETHDKYFPGHVGEEEYKNTRDHRWPCFIIDPQVVVALSMMWDYGEFASLNTGREDEGLYVGNTGYLADMGFRFRLPDLSYSVEYMKRHNIPNDRYREMISRFAESTLEKRKLGIQYGNIGWNYRGDVLQYDRRAKGPSSMPESIDRLVEARLREMQEK